MEKGSKRLERSDLEQPVEGQAGVAIRRPPEAPSNDTNTTSHRGAGPERLVSEGKGAGG